MRFLRISLCKKEDLWAMELEKMGFARNNQRMVFILFEPEDYFSLKGGSLDDYKDFLLAREERIGHLEKRGWHDLEPVPFDREDYSAWLQSDPSRKGLVDPFGQWALEVARESARLSSLRSRHHYPPFVPPDEQLQVEVEAWVFPVEADGYATFQGLNRPLPGNLLKELAESLLAAGKKSASPFQRLSRRRARGLAVVPFDRFADPARLFWLKKKFFRLFCNGGFSELPACFSLPWRCFFRPRPDMFFRRTALSLPFLVVGSKVEISLFGLEVGVFDLSKECAWKECLLFSGLGRRAGGGLFMGPKLARLTAREVSLNI